LDSINCNKHSDNLGIVIKEIIGTEAPDEFIKLQDEVEAVYEPRIRT